MAPASPTLASGAEMPSLGLGTWQLTEGTAGAVEQALRAGYRMIDTSGDYGTQRGVGEALRSAPPGPAGRRAFLVTKVEEDEDAYEAARRNVEELGVGRVDLLLVHRPPPDGVGEDLYRGLLRARREGLAADVGVSNYTADELDELIEACGEAPAVNQVEWSPFGHSMELLEHARRNAIAIQAYSPLTRGRRLGDPALAEIASRAGCTPAQAMLRWSIQLGCPPLPKPASAAHREENLGALGIELGEAEMEALSALNERYSSLAGLPYA